jgi:hypothetical protein
MVLRFKFRSSLIYFTIADGEVAAVVPGAADVSRDGRRLGVGQLLALWEI